MLVKKILTMNELPETIRIEHGPLQKAEEEPKLIKTFIVDPWPFNSEDTEKNAEFRLQERKMMREARARKNERTHTNIRNIDIWKND